MTTGESPGEQSSGRQRSEAVMRRPDWADGLRQLYDSVVDEPLPESFMHLLSQLDASGSDSRSGGAGGSDGSPG